MKKYLFTLSYRDTVLLISKDIIEVKMLNDEFINKSFNDDIREKIIINYDAGDKNKITIYQLMNISTKYAFNNDPDSGVRPAMWIKNDLSIEE